VASTDLLDGVRVLDLGIWRPAPFATQLLAELGASVTKVEPPGGDPMRAFPTLYRALNGRKQIVERNLKERGDRADVLALASEVDVAVEGFRPGVATRLGVDYAALRAANPAIVYCSISGYGQDGPLRDASGHDLNYQAWTGFLAARLPEIHTAGVPVGDLAGGVYAAMAVCAAIVGRARTGEGTYIDVSMADVLLSWAAPAPGGELASSDEPGEGFPAYGTFACVDGFVTLGVVTEDAFWRDLCSVLGLDDIAALDVRARAVDGRTLRSRIAGAVGTWKRDELVHALTGAGVPAAPVVDADEAARLEHFLARGVSRVVDDTVELDHPVRFGTPPRDRRRAPE
jgi:crotonobetainyl-CoA:carnitine CoA-transferase CaiB-like acyl-CoA transferase